MPFTGKAKYDANEVRPEGIDDVSDLVGLISPFDTPLLDALGSPRFGAVSTRHEWRDGDRMRENFTQIFTEAVTIANSMDAVGLHTVEREFDYQVIQRLRELMRSLEQTVINGFRDSVLAEANRRKMAGLLQLISGDGAVTLDAKGGAISPGILNTALDACRDRNGAPDLLVCNGFQKRRISTFLEAGWAYEPETGAVKNLIDYFEGDNGRQRIVLSRWVPADKILLLESEKVQVMPLKGRSFFVKPLAESGDFKKAQLIGEYTLEVVGAQAGAHAVISGLAAQ